MYIFAAESTHTIVVNQKDKEILVPIKPIIGVTWIWERIVAAEVIAGFRILEIYCK